MKRISIGLWKKKAFDPDTRFVIGANNRFILSSRLTLEYQTVMQLPFIKKKKSISIESKSNQFPRIETRANDDPKREKNPAKSNRKQSA